MRDAHLVRDASAGRAARPPETSGSTLLSIQYVRAVAALLVVYVHVFSNRVAAHWSGGSDVGVFGVDLFFVVSGVVMWRTTSGPRTPRPVNFMLRRAIRIYPAWWVALALWIGLRLAIPDRLHGADLTRGSIVASVLLFPHHHAVFAGRIWPILVPGWTLQIELVFYAIFAAALAQPRPASRLLLVLGALVLLPLVGLATAPTAAPLQELTSPLLPEFALGVAIGAGAGRVLRLSRAALMALTVAGLGILLLTIALVPHLEQARSLTLGPAAALLVTALLGAERALRARPVAPLLRLGDASYSLYLTHPLAISAAAVLWERLHLPAGRDPRAILFVPVAVAAATGGALAFYRLIELPVLGVIGRLRRRETSPAILVPGS